MSDEDCLDITNDAPCITNKTALLSDGTVVVTAQWYGFHHRVCDTVLAMVCRPARHLAAGQATKHRLASSSAASGQADLEFDCWLVLMLALVCCIRLYAFDHTKTGIFWCQQQQQQHVHKCWCWAWSKPEPQWCFGSPSSGWQPAGRSCSRPPVVFQQLWQQSFCSRIC